jgi:hypothetical protein
MLIYCITINRFFGHFLVKNELFLAFCGQKPTFYPYLFLLSDFPTIVKDYIKVLTKVGKTDK